MNELLRLKNINMYIVIFFIISGIVCGSIISGKMADYECETLFNYFESYFSGLSDSAHGLEIIKKTTVQLLPVFLVVFFSGFLRVGIIFNLFCVAKRGFVTGFTFAAIYKIYGFSGILTNMSFLPELLIFLPSLAIMSAASFKMSVMKYDDRMSNAKKYILVCLLCAIAFGISCLCRAYLTESVIKLTTKR